MTTTADRSPAEREPKTTGRRGTGAIAALDDAIIHIEVADNSVRIFGQRKEEKEEKGKTYHRVERRSGEFSESMVLPCSVEDRVEAEYHDGVLTVTLPKAESAKPKTIKVKTNSG